MKKFAIVIPARLASTRFPAKSLAQIKGKPLIRHAVERVCDSRVGEVIVATDSEDIKAAVADMPCSVFMSRTEHACGTDRIAEVARELNADFIVNVQGDQLVPGPGTIDAIIDGISPELSLATCYTDISDRGQLIDKNVVKAVVGRTGEIIYMSRLPIPFNRDNTGVVYHMQVGIYVFAREALLEFAALEPTPLELAEGVELLRALDNGIRLTGIKMDAETGEVNTPDDVGPAEDFVEKYPVKNVGVEH